ncbi:Hypothetical predicted protein [Cloeon dipterum]|uniref:Uncharacterized protein n=1 Tax=Cloeon dipterum TaxID=197152 RepID=A0A8S1DEW6_9INSE|nr:Hypothetical predicted protein [Cloeon dipterum]
MEHHRISVEGIIKSSPKGQYWGVAIHFLISIKGHGSEHWIDFQRQLRHEEITCHPYISDTTRLKLLPNGAPQYVIKSLNVHCYYTPRVGKRTLKLSKNGNFLKKLGIYDPRSWMRVSKNRKLFFQSDEISDNIDEPTMIVATEKDNGILVSIFQSKISLRAESETFIEFGNRTNNESRETDSTLNTYEPMKFEEISKQLKQQLELDKEKWSLRDLFHITYKRKTEETPVTMLPIRASEDPLMIANHFETRIKKLVKSIVTSQYPDHSFAQYMLPCFVASFLEMTTAEESHA